MEYLDQMNISLGYRGLLNIFIALCCIGLSWWGLQTVRLDLFLKHPKSAQARWLQIALSMALGYQLSRFIMDYLTWSTWLPGLF